MAFASIVTIANGTTIRKVKLDDCLGGRSTAEVDKFAGILSSIIEKDRDVLKIEVDYTGCRDEDVISRYDP